MEILIRHRSTTTVLNVRKNTPQKASLLLARCQGMTAPAPQKLLHVVENIE